MSSYRVQIFAADASNGFAVGNLIEELPRAKNLGYADYLNDVGEAFWTINQDDIRAGAALRAGEGKAHVKIIRNDTDVVWRGVLAEHDADVDDVIMYAYSYESILYHLISRWNQTWKSAKIAGASGRPVNDLWSRAVNLDHSQLGFATTGTLQAPVTTSNGSTEITLESYKVYWRRMLHAFKELTAIATSDTTNICFFELDYTNSPTNNAITFNFWKDNGSDIDIRLAYPDRIVGFSDRYVPIYTRNDLFAVGVGARDQLYRKQVETTGGTFGINAFGRKMEPIYLSWVRDEAELDRVSKLRAAKAKREDVNLYVRLKPDCDFLPWRATGSGYELGDRINIDIQRGITRIDKPLFVAGEQVVWANGVEYVQPLLADRAGSE